MNILVLGGASFDDILHVDEFFEPKKGTIFVNKSYSSIGSTGVGKALALKALGFNVTFQAVIGDDYFGDKISHQMKKAGVKFIPFIADKTERHTNIMNKSGERITIFSHTPEDFVIDVYKFEKQIKEADIVVLNIKNYCRYFIPLIKKYRKPTFCDIHDFDGHNPHHQDFILNSDYIFMSSDNMTNYRPYMDKLINKGKKWVVVTHANKGASALDQSGYEEIPANVLDIVDTNGAGDNFFAGYLYGYLNDYNKKDSLLMGRIVAECCIQSKKIVSKELNEDYLKENFKKLKNIVEKLYDIV